MIKNWTATLSVNAGLSLRSEGLCIWVDAVHDIKEPDYSTLTPERQRFLFESDDFKDPDVIFFTHCHNDHFSSRMCAQAMRIYPSARLIAPEPVCDGQILLQGNEMLINIKNRLLTFRRLIHEGDQYKDVPHYGLLVEDDGDRLLVLGDCAVEGEDLRKWIRREPVDTVFVPYSWIIFKRGRDFLIEELRPSQIVIYHLPLREDDMFGFVKITEKAALRLKNICDVRIMTEAFQKEEL